MRNSFIGFTFLFVFISCRSHNQNSITLKNDLNFNRVDELVRINLKDLNSANPQKLTAFEGTVELPSQLEDNDEDGTPDNFLFLVDLDANETKEIIFKEVDSKKKFLQRAHAEIYEKVDYKLIDGIYTGGKFMPVVTSTTPPGHIDHNNFYKCEGPSWESDKVGYRLYLDWRNSTDIFGKKVTDIVLPGTGHLKDSKGEDDYHTMADWGMDLFKVGNSLGIGAFGAWVDEKVVMVSKTDSTTCKIVDDGPLLAKIDIEYFGWDFGKGKSNLNSNLSLAAGSRLTHYSFKVGSNHSEYCTGLSKHDNTEFITSDIEQNNGWNYIALWGKQSVAGAEDKLGIALFFNTQNFVNVTEDKLSEIIVLKSNNNQIDYYFAACWEQEPDGIKNIDGFKDYLKNTVELLNSPLIVSK